MPATNYTPIQLYRSTTSGSLPLAANLSPGELALNIADNDMTMYMENASGVVKSFFNNPAALKYPTADGTSGQIIQTNGAGVLSFGSAPSSALTNNTRQAVTSSATTTINLNSGNVIDLTMAANITTLSFTNVPASGTPILIQIVVKNASSGTAYTIVWPNSVYWSGQYVATTSATVQTAPTLATGNNGITVIALLTTDGGTKWRGWVEATIPGLTESKLYSWGQGFLGRLGLGYTTNRSSPVQVGALIDWAVVDAGSEMSAAVKTDGTLWSWGANSAGNLGQNNLTNRSSPVQVGSDTNWGSVSAGNNSCAAIKNDGTLWTWGNGQYGKLGQNNLTYRSSPTQVGSLSDWALISMGVSSSSAIKTDGTLWTWGIGSDGRLGQNSTTSLSSPVQVGSLSTWSKTSMGFKVCGAIKTDGTFWSWGSNYAGGLGLGNTTYRSSPTQVGSLGDWSKLSVAWVGYFMLAIKTDNTLWSWGRNSDGQLGDNASNSRSSPVQVGSLTWSEISAGSSTSAAIRTNGTLWTWGNGGSGILGQNSTTTQSSPIQVGALTSWASISAADTHCVARTYIKINPAA